jgi:hypothetical protein
MMWMLHYCSHAPSAMPLVIMMVPYSVAIPVLTIRTPVIGWFSRTQSDTDAFT